MRYLANYDSYTRIAETTGTIQKGDTVFDLESRVYDPETSKTAIRVLNPQDLQAFTGKEIVPTLEKAKLFMRIDTDYEDSLIQSLMDAATSYIEVATGLTAEQQAEEILCETLQKFLVTNWFENRDNGGNMAGNSTILSLLKAIKAKASR